jgi:hypothetical protein
MGAVLSLPSCAFALWNTVFQALQIVCRKMPTMCTATLWLVAFKFLGYQLCCPLQNLYAAVANVSVLLAKSSHAWFIVFPVCGRL